MKTNIFLLTCFIVFIIAACEDVIEVDLSNEYDNLMAVEARITTEDNPWVYFYTSQNVALDKSYDGISGARVFIADDAQPSNTVQLVESVLKNGLYTIPAGENYYGMTGREYTVRIEYKGVTITARDNLSRVEPIDSIQVRASLRGDKRFLGIFTYGKETPGPGNFYKWDIYINDTLLNESRFMIFANDEQVDGNYVGSFEIFTDFHDPKKPEDRILKYLDNVYVKQLSISKEAYFFYYQMFSQSMTGGSFSVPPANIRGNFSSSDGKNVLGIFTAHDVSTSNKVNIDESIENQLVE